MPCCGQCEMPHVRFLTILNARALSGNEKICGASRAAHQSPSSSSSCPRREIHPLERFMRCQIVSPSLIYSIWFDDRAAAARLIADRADANSCDQRWFVLIANASCYTIYLDKFNYPYLTESPLDSSVKDWYVVFIFYSHTILWRFIFLFLRQAL